jgi:competence protein ComEC
MVVGLNVGVIFGAVMAAIFDVKFFAPVIWIVAALVLVGATLVKPKMFLVVLAFVAGNLLMLCRAANEPATTKIVNEDSPVLIARDWFAERIDSLIPEKENRLGKSYLLGMKSGLSEDFTEYLRVVGLTHIVVASGAHLSILVEIARKIFGKLSRFAGLFFSLLFILFFMAMVGWTPSIMRAGIMAILTLVTWYVGRKMAPLRMIITVMAITLLIKPSFLLNIGWLLSFASYAGIMLVGPELNKFFYGEKKPGFIGSTVLTTVAATIMTLPVTLYFFGAVSLISVFANLLILPTLSYAMGLTFLAGVVAGMPGIETIVGFLATKLLGFHIAVVEFFGEMKYVLVQIQPYQAWVFSIYVLIFSPLIYLWMNRQKRNLQCDIMKA